MAIDKILMYIGEEKMHFAGFVTVYYIYNVCFTKYVKKELIISLKICQGKGLFTNICVYIHIGAPCNDLTKTLR